jgi:hypothetical protein
MINIQERELLVLEMKNEGKSLKEIADYLHSNNLIANGGKAGVERTRQILLKAKAKAKRQQMA